MRERHLSGQRPSPINKGGNVYVAPISILDSTRRDVAENLLRTSRYTLTEVAFLTGFSEQSACNRAFKRWTGRTPSALGEATGP